MASLQLAPQHPQLGIGLHKPFTVCCHHTTGDEGCGRTVVHWVCVVHGVLCAHADWSPGRGLRALPGQRNPHLLRVQASGLRAAEQRQLGAHCGGRTAGLAGRGSGTCKPCVGWWHGWRAGRQATAGLVAVSTACLPSRHT